MTVHGLLLVLAFVLDSSRADILDENIDAGKLAMLFSVSTVPPFFGIEKRSAVGIPESVEFVTDDYQDLFTTAVPDFKPQTLDAEEENGRPSEEFSKEAMSDGQISDPYYNYEHLFKDVIEKRLHESTMQTTSTTVKPSFPAPMNDYVVNPLIKYPRRNFY